MQYWWPIGMIVLSNVLYQVCAKASPAAAHPLASLTVTYLVSAACSFGLYFVLEPGGNLLREYRSLNWSVFVFGLVLVGLEIGSIYMYKAGWDVSRGFLVHSGALAVCLIVLGGLAYHEQITLSKLAGAVLIFAGLYFVNR
ncbi:MAG: EamA family transporter [Oscillibacter sp.]|nr:EamA family transporter [Oscillibacter sp.]